MTNAMGWRRDLADARDYAEGHPKVSGKVEASKSLKAAGGPAPSSDLRQWMPPVFDQGNLGSCVENAIVGAMGYFQKRSADGFVMLSRLQLYWMTRRLAGLPLDQDTGSQIRDGIKALALVGTGPEKFWPYDVKAVAKQPDNVAVSLGRSYRADSYFRLDPPGRSAPDVIKAIKTVLTAGFPVVYGQTVYSSFPGLSKGDSGHDVPLPAKGDKVDGGHAMLISGHSDAYEIGPSKGAFLIRNSWGEDWGLKGYGWLPYDYVRAGLASDFWCVVHAGFVNTDLFA